MVECNFFVGVVLVRLTNRCLFTSFENAKWLNTCQKLLNVILLHISAFLLAGLALNITEQDQSRRAT